MTNVSSMRMLNPSATYVGIKPIGYDKKGAIFSQRDVSLGVVNLMQGENYVKQKVMRMSKEIAECDKVLNEAIDLFEKSLDKLVRKENEFHDKARSVAREIKNASENIGQGIARVEKSANFDRLERYVTLIERAAKAMEMLYELEKVGKLEKIAKALQ